MKKRKILVLFGPNLNLLGEREPEIYGTLTLAQVKSALKTEATRLKVQVEFYQSNHEGRLIDKLHVSRKAIQGVLINPAAFTHYSVALRDALLAIQKPFVEVHFSDPSTRERFRKVSLFEDIAVKSFKGKGLESHLEGLCALVKAIS